MAKTGMNDKKILIEQLKHIANRLMEEGRKMADEPLIIDYDNGGGQAGIRENPFYPAYEKLLASYTKGLTALKEMGGKGADVTNLEDLRSKFKVAK